MASFLDDLGYFSWTSKKAYYFQTEPESSLCEEGGLNMDCCSVLRGIFFTKQQYRGIVESEETTPILPKTPDVDLTVNTNGNQLDQYNNTSRPPTQGRSREVEIGTPINGNGNGSGLHDPHQQMSKAVFFAKYELRDEIGVGSTSKCYKCVRRADRKYVMQTLYIASAYC